MRILFLVDKFPVISETFVLNQITGLIDLGHDVEICARARGDTDKVHKDTLTYELLKKTFYLQKPKSFLQAAEGMILLLKNILSKPFSVKKILNRSISQKMSLSFRLVLLIKMTLSQPYDVVLCHFGPNGNWGLVLKDFGLVKKVATIFHGYDLSVIAKESGTRIYEDLFRRGDLFLPISDYWKKELIRLGCPPEKIKVHHMGIDVEMFNVNNQKETHSKNINLLSVGRFVQKKGFEFAIRAVAALIQQGHKICYQIVGSGPLEEDLKTLVKELHIEKQVDFLGMLNAQEIKQEFQQAHIFLLPSVTADNGDKEGIPVVLMEAMASGLAVVTTEHSGIPELVKDRSSGFLVPERNVELIVERLDQLICHPSQRIEMGDRGRDMFHIKKLNKRLETILIGEK